ncbi:unnamed protein product (macronuclear) [Paramecium tetraurelia]|uniref:Uncharacterized protein n=1 Tax=Paramecium tetraurelia TaxID=5888 RepID=A0EFV6_PARTE|nr:uncharacterized protein GSPATT00026520001 [Paramecium tetraurelia]CAK94197.1 unnamed protein product [Paramecium tetraurelia]|eukprot:XP_001461570.1 hypothetical protein (macronuclear) [Paramecium tetraurelia strain d4-2]
MNRARFDETNRKFQEYQAEFKIPLLPSSQQENFNAQTFYRLYPELTPLNAIKPHQAQAFNPEKTRLYIESLQKQNQEINFELRQQAHDIVALSQMVNTLIDENRSLSLLLEQKDQEMHSIVETMTINEAEEIQDLRHQLRLLEDENCVLLKHVQEQRQQLDDKIQDGYELEKQFQNSKKYCLQLEQQVEKYKLSEISQTEQMQIIKENCRTEIELKNSYQFENQKKDSIITSLTFTVEKLNKQLLQFQSDFEKLQSDKNDLHSQSNLKIYELNQKLDDQSNEISKYQIINNQLTKEIDQYHEELKDKQFLCDQIADQNDDIMNKLQMEIEKSRKLSDNEARLQEHIGKLSLQNAEYFNELNQQSEQIGELIDTAQRDLETQKLKFNESMQKLKQDYLNDLKDKQLEIQELEEKNTTILKEWNAVKNEHEILKIDYEQCKKEISDYQQQKRIIEQLQLQNRQLKLQLEENKALLQEFVSHKGGVQADIEERDKQIQKIINQKDDRIAELERDFQMYYEKCAILQQHQKNNEHLEQLNFTFREQKELFEQENERLKQEISKLQGQINNYATVQKQQKLRADKQIIEENQQLRKELNEKANELQKLKDQQPNMNTLPLPPKQPSEAGSRVRQGQPSQDFQQTKQNQVYLAPQQLIQPSSPHHSQHSPALSRRNIQESDDGSVKGGGNTQNKNMQYSFADDQLKQQQQQQQQQQQRQRERENSYHSNMSNAPYRKKSQQI